MPAQIFDLYTSNSVTLYNPMEKPPSWVALPFLTIVVVWNKISLYKITDLTKFSVRYLLNII